MRGYVIYEGPSRIDGSEIVAIVTMKSVNGKTGDMPSMWILPKWLKPTDASKEGIDRGVCGDCPLRWHTGGACYVNLGQAPNAVYRTWKAGGYGELPFHYGVAHEHLYAPFIGTRMRYGAYGDPFAIPSHILRAITSVVELNTSYTHQWEWTDDPIMKQTSMASADSYDQGILARKEGWRTYRVTHDLTRLHPDEIVCPHYTHGVKCRDCRLCGGTNTKAKSIVAPAHGARKNRFVEPKSESHG